MKVVQKNESSGNITSSNITVKDSFLNRGTSDFRGSVTFKDDVIFKGTVHGLNEIIVYHNTCPTSKFPPPLASTFGPTFIAQDGTYRFYVEIAFTQNSRSEIRAFLTADFYINGKAMHGKPPESYEKFIIQRTMVLKKDDKVELRICEDFFSGTTYVLDPEASYYEIVSL